MRHSRGSVSLVTTTTTASSAVPNSSRSATSVKGCRPASRPTLMNMKLLPHRQPSSRKSSQLMRDDDDADVFMLRMVVHCWPHDEVHARARR